MSDLARIYERAASRITDQPHMTVAEAIEGAAAGLDLECLAEQATRRVPGAERATGTAGWHLLVAAVAKVSR